MEDKKIIELFFARSESAIQALSEKYEKLLHKISFQILHNEEDVAECINDTYLGVWNTIPPTNPNPLCAFVCKITRNLSLKKYRTKTAAKRDASLEVSLEELEPVIFSPSAEEEWSAVELGEKINLFLHTLDAESRVQFVRRYWFADSIGEIARDLRVSENVVSVRLGRIRKKLKRYLEQEGYTV